MVKKEKVILTGQWVIKKKLTPVELQRLLILARSAGLKSYDNHTDEWYLDCLEGEEWASFGTTIISGEQVMDIYYGINEERTYTYTEVMNALVKKIKANSKKYK